MLECLICHRLYKHLGSHIGKGHKITAKQYKMEFGLSIKHALITDEIKRKKQLAFEEDREKYLANITGPKSKKYQFKKGKVYRDYFSEEDLARAQANLDKINTKAPQNCPFCNLLIKHLESHIYNAHGYLKVRKTT